jgi:hypothetical protein
MLTSLIPSKQGEELVPVITRDRIIVTSYLHSLNKAPQNTCDLEGSSNMQKPVHTKNKQEEKYH